MGNPAFQSTLPVWGATHPPCTHLAASGISIHAPRVGSDWMQVHYRLHFDISIHAPRVGSDIQARMRGAKAKEISIHAPRVGSDRL